MATALDAEFFEKNERAALELSQVPRTPKKNSHHAKYESALVVTR
jgi:hypothetical protein